MCISFWRSQHTYTQTCGDAAKHGANKRWRRIFDLSIMTCRETRNHIIMLKQSPVHTHLLTTLITHHLINTLFNLLPSNTELFGRVKQVLFFPFLFFYCAVFIACFLKKLFCNLNQDACGPDRSGLLEEESEDCWQRSDVLKLNFHWLTLGGLWRPADPLLGPIDSDAELVIEWDVTKEMKKSDVQHLEKNH